MKKQFLQVLLAAAMTFFYGASMANNLRITGTAVSGSNITFNIAWDNSWYANIAPANNDAAWVFIKYQDCATQQWAHASLSTLVADHTAGSPLVVETTTDGKGVFLRRGALGGGNIASTAVTLKMNIPAGTYNYKVFGVEMAKVLQDTFQVGDGVAANGYSSITITANRQANGVSGSTLGGGSVSLPATYPMGYNSFYCMKYEISQQQYVDFLNSLQYRQQESRTTAAPNSAAGTLAFSTVARTYHNGITIQTPGSNAAIPAVYANDYNAGTYNDIDDAQNGAEGYLNWADLSAYLDWAALRPMTELEYEKTCRGPVSRVAGEFPWGTITSTPVQNANIINVATGTETLNSVQNGICNYYAAGYPGFPIRCGFAASATSGRISAGAAYYGMMEMGGNVYEQVVNTTTSEGAAYDGTLGDGTLSATGDANQTTWPSPTTGTGAGTRGGACDNYNTYAQVSNRTYQATVITARAQNCGGRGVR